MKKTLLAFTVFIGSALSSQSQNNIGIGTASPDASALLDLSSSSKGILIPRMTTAQRNAVAAPSKGLMVFDTDTNSFWYFNGST